MVESRQRRKGYPSATGFINPGAPSGYNHPSANTNEVGTAGTWQPPSWLSAPDLGYPDWPTDSLNTTTTDAYAAINQAPVFSPGIFTPTTGGDSSWYYFDPSFAQDSNFRPIESTLASPTTDVGNTPTYVPLSLVNAPAASMARDDDDDNNGGDSDMINGPSRSESTSWSSPYYPPKTARGNTKKAAQQPSSSTPERQSSRIRATKQHASGRRKSFPSNSSDTKLRGIKAGRPSTSVDTGGENIGDVGQVAPAGRALHNQVEKQYRNRLNSQFSSLVAALPPDVISAELDGSGNRDRRLSKGEVLVLARRYVQTLEWQKKGLETEKAESEEAIQRLKVAWAKMNRPPLV